MTRLVSRAESWQRVYQSFQTINFAAYDYLTVKQSLIEALRLNFSESFNDFIETSELIAIVESFAYIAEQLAYRLDLNAHENFITDAQRRESILRLARFISYTASRPMPARGFVKFTSVSTTETVYDSNGVNLANKVIRWNDATNPSWKEQFILVMNRVLEQEFGSVPVASRFSIQDVDFEQYSIDLSPLTNGVFSYNVTADGRNAPMELVSTVYDPKSASIVERRPANNSNFTLLYANDGNGDGSSSTGFLIQTKQGKLQRTRATFDGTTPNQTYDLGIDNVNDIDVWLNNVDTAGNIITDIDASIVTRSTAIPGEWVQVDVSHAQNVLFNTNPFRNKYEIETRDSNRIRLIFGDGEFSTIPSGTFDIWARSSIDASISIPQSSVVSIPQSLTYQDLQNRTQTLKFTVSLTSTLQNGSASETNDHIRRVAPGVYYTQDRMVNGEDYNSYPLQDPSILKLQAINRSFAGESKYMSWHDSSESYENVSLYTNDAVLYIDSVNNSQRVSAVSNNVIISNYVQPLLSDPSVVQQITSTGVSPHNIRRVFNVTETNALTSALTPPPELIQADIYFSAATLSWIPVKRGIIPLIALNVTSSIPLITIDQTSIDATTYDIATYGQRLLLTSQTLMFWNNNGLSPTVDYSSERASLDSLTILSANKNADGTALLATDIVANVLGVAPFDTDTNPQFANLPDIHTLNLSVQDEDRDGYPDQLAISPTPAPDGFGALLTTTSYVYLTRIALGYPWVPAPSTAATIAAWLADTYNPTTNPNGLWKRVIGRDKLNVVWRHHTPLYHLVDPTPTNIIDMFVITQGYYNNIKKWVSGALTTAPTPPTSRELRTSYGSILTNKMISDTVIMHPGKIRILFGSKAAVGDRAVFKIVKTTASTKTDSQLKVLIVDVIRSFFDINGWEFGETLYMPELEAAIQISYPADIAGVVVVPTALSSQYGNLTQLAAREDEVFYADVSTASIEMVASYTAENMRLDG